MGSREQQVLWRTCTFSKKHLSRLPNPAQSMILLRLVASTTKPIFPCVARAGPFSAVKIFHNHLFPFKRVISSSTAFQLSWTQAMTSSCFCASSAELAGKASHLRVL